MKYDTVIIGSGMSGLTAALTLAQNGLKVALVESCGHIAPLLKRFKRGNVWCDPGLHYSGGFEKSGPLTVIFNYLGMEQRIKSIPMNSECYDELNIGDKVISLAGGFDGVRASLSKHFPQDTKAILAYTDKIQKIMNETPFINFDLAFADFSRISHVDESLFDFLDSVNATKELKDLLSHYGLFLYGVKGSEAPFYIHALVMGSFYKSPHTLEGGGDEIVNAFRERLMEEGVHTFCNSPATGLKIDDKRRLEGIIISGNKLLQSENCIFTAHPHLLEKILPERAVRPAYLSRLRDMKNTPSVFSLYLELDEIPERLHHTNVYKFSADKNEESSLAIMSCDPEIYDKKKKGLCILVNAKTIDPQNIPYGEKKRTPQYRDYKKRLTERTVKDLINFYPELEGRFKVVASATPFTYERYTGSPGGASYGLKQSVQEMKLGPVTSILGLYLAGQSILMPGIMGASISGLIGASNIIGMESLWNEVRKCR